MIRIIRPNLRLHFFAPALVCFAFTLVLSNAFAQIDPNCTGTVQRAQPNGPVINIIQVPAQCEIFFVDSAFSLVRADNMLRQTTAVVNIQQAGCYRISGLVHFDSGDHQKNESFYLEVHNSDGSISTPLDSTNVGPYKVIKDIGGPVGVFAQQDAGLFYFAAGIDTIQMWHYINIRHIDDSLWDYDPNSDVAESVEMYDFFLLREEYDLALSHVAASDTVHFNTPYAYELVVQNSGPDTARTIKLVDALPAALPASIPILTTPAATRQDSILLWEFAAIPPGAAQSV
ncbi:MAG: hypothetical protein D6814_00465, partial [Calditrichaeota bacterium]